MACKPRGAALFGRMAPIHATILSIMMLAVFALTAGGIVLIRRDRRKGILMLVAAAVLLGNVAIWTL